MKTKSKYLELKGMTINEFRNNIIYELKNRRIYGIKTRVSKYKLKLIYNDDCIYIPYRTLETKTTFKDIIDFYIADIKDMVGE